MRFVKMHGIGNDYVYIDAFNDPALAQRRDLPQLARAMSDRHTGVGSDGLILVCRPTDANSSAADVRMRMFNADGSESEMCGNGIRCVAKFAHDHLGVRTTPIRVETGRGILSIDYRTEAGRLVGATVDMGTPILELAAIPVDESKVERASAPHEYSLRAGDRLWRATFVSMGNPHAVIFADAEGTFTVDRLRATDLGHIGPALENHPAFPRRMNVHLVAVQSRREGTMRTWERGSGITMACGTGAAAVAVAGVLTGRLEREVLLHLPGGDLRLRWDAHSGRVLKTGPAVEVFTGDWPE